MDGEERGTQVGRQLQWPCICIRMGEEKAACGLGEGGDKAAYQEAAYHKRLGKNKTNRGRTQCGL